MTSSDFILLCNEKTIAPEIALENENIINALKAKDDKEVIRILNEEF